MLETILILDCDQSLSGLIARTLRSQDFYCELVPPETTAPTLRGMETVKGIIIAAENGGRPARWTRRCSGWSFRCWRWARRP